MAHIQIVERTTVTEANAVVSFDHGSEYPITVQPPFADKAKQQERDLEWYFEQHLAYPFMAQERAKQVSASIKPYGEQLFDQVFKTNPDVYHIYKKCAEVGLSALTFEIAGSPGFHALHWEALKDPNVPHPFALDATMVRKNLVPVAFEASVRPSPTINILVITARPNGKNDVGYRTISLPLVQALRQANVPVQIDFVRPGTYVALEQHLARITAKHGIGYYHVIHFDVHGAVLTYGQFQIEQQLNRYLYQDRPGFDRPNLHAYKGEKAFLFLQGDTMGRADPVEASELANMLLAHQIPIALLNACQSGKTPDAGRSEEADGQEVTLPPRNLDMRESSLGQHLMRAGVQVVLAMSYSVTVSAAERLIPELYTHMFAGDDLATAIRFARIALATYKERRAYYNYQIDLEDWLLPIVYQNQQVHLSLRPFTTDEEQSYYERQAKRYREPATTYRFVGRDLDLLEIEQRVLIKNNSLLLRGMGGAGKTTLLHHLATWWQTTRLVEQVFYFSYDVHAWDCQQIIHAIAEQLVGKDRYQREFQPFSPDAQQSKLTALLRATRHLLILDNLESITGAQFAVLHTLPKQEQEALRRLLTDLAGGKTLVLLGSRGEEAWLAPGTFADNSYTLGGLDSEATSTLTDLILAQHSATQYCTNADLQTLVKLLDGFPLALQIVLANLSHHTPADILATLQTGNAALDAQDGSDKTESILTCIDYSYRNLSPEAQHLLLCLAPFTSIIDTRALKGYTDLLKASPLLATLPFERWSEMLSEAQQWGLLIPDATIPFYLHLQPVFPYFLRTRLQSPEAQERRATIDTAFYQHYNEIGYELYQLLQSKEPRERTAGQVMVQFEYENLVMALRLALAAHASTLAPYLPLDEYLYRSQEAQRGLALAQIVQAALQTYPAELLTGPLEEEMAIMLIRVANFHLDLKQYAAAEQTYQQVVAIWEKQSSDATPARKQQFASVYHQLGLVAQKQRLWQQAEQYYQQALRLKEELEDRHEQATTYHNLGVVAQEQRLWPQAEQYYHYALRIEEEFEDYHEQATTYNNLGRIAQEQGQWSQAEHYYQQALSIYQEFHDRSAQANIYHNLGVIGQMQGQWQQAERYYQQALSIHQEFHDRSDQADTYHNLGVIAQEQGQWQQAEQYHQQALSICQEFHDHYSQAKVYHSLGVIAQEQGQWQQAEHYYQQALRIFEEFHDHSDYELARTYGQLGHLALTRGQWQLARHYLLQALMIFMKYEDGYASITFHNLALLWLQRRERKLLTQVAEIVGMRKKEVEQAFLAVWEAYRARSDVQDTDSYGE